MSAPAALVRYCCHCGHVGPVDTRFLNCCPDGGSACMVPPAVAEQARAGFMQQLHALMGQPPGSMPPGWRAAGFSDDDEYVGITIAEYLAHRNENECMDAWGIGHVFTVDAACFRTEQWRVTNDAPWQAERLDPPPAAR